MPMPEQSLSSELEQYCVVEGCNSNREYMMGKLLYNIFCFHFKRDVLESVEINEDIFDHNGGCPPAKNLP